MEIIYGGNSRVLVGYCRLETRLIRPLGIAPLQPIRGIRGKQRQSGSDNNSKDDQRRQYYRLTPRGRELLRMEADRLQALVDVERASRARAV